MKTLPRSVMVRVSRFARFRVLLLSTLVAFVIALSVAALILVPSGGDVTSLIPTVYAQSDTAQTNTAQANAPSSRAALPFRHFPPTVFPFRGLGTVPMNPAGAAASAQVGYAADPAQRESAGNPAAPVMAVEYINLTFTTIDVPGAVYTGAGA